MTLMRFVQTSKRKCCQLWLVMPTARTLTTTVSVHIQSYLEVWTKLTSSHSQH